MPSPYYHKLLVIATVRFGVGTVRLKRAVAAAALSGGLMLGIMANAFAAVRLDYFALFGEWSVICSGDEAAGERSCVLEAPPLDPYRPRNAIELRRGENGEPEVAVRRRETVNPTTPVFVRIDAHPPHQASPAPDGEVIWRAPESTQIVEELKTGEEMVLRSFTSGDSRPRDEFISLSGFGKAWEAFWRQSAQPSSAVSGEKAEKEVPESDRSR
jgi:hypothetical protein